MASSKYDDFDRMLDNWARWMFGDTQQSMVNISSIYRLGPRPPRYGNTMPIINGEAIDLDKAIKRLHLRLQEVLKVEVQEWIYPTQELKARRLSVCVKTYKLRLEDAKLMAKREYYQRCEKVLHKVPIHC